MCTIHCKRMSLLNVESYNFINVFCLVLFCIYVCVDDAIEKKIVSAEKNLYFCFWFIILYFVIIILCVLSWTLEVPSYGDFFWGFQNVNCCNAWNVWVKRGEGELVGERYADKRKVCCLSKVWMRDKYWGLWE